MSALLGRAPPPRLDRLVSDIEAAIRSGDRDRQSDLLMRSADVLTRRWSRLPPPDKPAFDGLLAGLLDQVDENARATFARHLAPLRRAPRRAATRLATDSSITVARPLLETCPSFDEAWLLELVGRLEPAHQRAIARRQAVSAPVCDALVRLGTPGVAAVLLGNPGADISPRLLSALASRAAGSEAIAMALASRADLAAEDRAVLVDLAHRKALAALVADHGGDPAAAEALLALVAGTFASPVPPERASCYAGAAVIAGRPGGFGPGPVATGRLVQWLALRRLEDVVAVLARDAGLPIGVMIACTETASPQALALVLRGLGHSWTLLKALLRRPSAPDPDPEVLAAVHWLHAETSNATARTVARYAAVRIGLSAFAAADKDRRSEGPAETATTRAHPAEHRDGERGHA